MSLFERLILQAGQQSWPSMDHETQMAEVMDEVLLDVCGDWAEKNLPVFSREYCGFEDAGIDRQAVWERRLALSDEQRETFDRLLLDYWFGNEDATEEILERWFQIAESL
jgi:hypothetical protein